MNNTVSVNNAHFILIDSVEGLLFFTKILVDKITFHKLSDQPRQEAPYIALGVELKLGVGGGRGTPIFSLSEYPSLNGV